MREYKDIYREAREGEEMERGEEREKEEVNEWKKGAER